MKDKICLICHTVIDMDNEYAEFKHYTKMDVIRSKAYYHINCFRDKLINANATGQVQIKAMEVLNKISGRL